MNVIVTDFVNGAKQAQGIVVIIDVFRAFSVACYSFAQGAESIIPVGRIERATALKTVSPSAILIGEREGKISSSSVLVSAFQPMRTKVTVSGFFDLMYCAVALAFTNAPVKTSSASTVLTNPCVPA